MAATNVIKCFASEMLAMRAAVSAQGDSLAAKLEAQNARLEAQNAKIDAQTSKIEAQNSILNGCSGGLVLGQVPCWPSWVTY